MYDKRLPTEVLYRIFKSLDRNDVYNCLFVCPSWYNAATPIIYKEITLNAQGTMLLNFTEDIDSVITPFEKYGKYVRSVKFYEDGIAKALSPSAFCTAMSWWPNLQLIDMHDSEHPDIYLEYLKDDPDIVLDHLQNIKVNHFFNRSRNGRDNIMELAFQTELRYCKSLTSIKVYEPHEDSPTPAEAARTNPLPNLHLFKNLTKIRYNNVIKNKLTPSKIQEILPNLTSLDFHATASYHGNYDDDTVPLILKSNTLKTLRIDFRDFTRAFIENLVSNIPPNLESLTLYSNRDYDFYRWIEREQVPDVLSFAMMLNKIPKISITTNGTFIFDEHEMQLSYVLANHRKTLFYSFFNEVIGNRDFVSCHVTYSNLHLCSQVSISGEPGNQKLFYSSYYNEDNAPPLEQDTTLKRTDIVTSLSYGSYRTTTPFPEKGLEFFLSKYPNLEFLEIKWGREDYYNFYLKEKLTLLDLGTITPTDGIVKTLNKYAPYIDTVWYRDNNISSDDNDVLLDLREFKSLQNVVFCFESAEDEHRNRLIVHFSYNDKPDEYYLIVPQKNDPSEFKCKKIRSEVVSELKDALEIGEVHFKFKTAMDKVIICKDTKDKNVLAEFSSGQHVAEPHALVTLEIPVNRSRYRA